jgi:hypothetical protein
MTNAPSKSLRGYSTLAVILATAVLTCGQFAPHARANWLTEALERVAANVARDEERALGHAGGGAIEHPGQTPHDVTAGSGLHISVENRLRAAYHSTALDEIHDASARERIRNVIRTHTTSQLASLAGREKQFASVANSQQYTMKVTYHSRTVIVNDKNQAMKIGANDSAICLRAIVSASSDRVPISAFSSQRQYREELEERLSRFGKALEEEHPRWKFSVSSGELEIPLSVKVGEVEVTAGSINLYEIAGKVAEKLFNSSALVAALIPVDGDQRSEQRPSSQRISDEENQRRQIETSLSGADLSELKQIAPDLFAG